MRAIAMLIAVLAFSFGSCADPVPVTPTAAPADRIVVLDKPWLPPWAGPNTPPEIPERAGLRFCGLEQGPAIDPDIRNCFVAAVVAGRDIEFARIESSVEGDPIATVFGFEPSGGFSMATDSTQDRYGFPGWSISFCSRIIPDKATVFVMDACVTGPTFR